MLPPRMTGGTAPSVRVSELSERYRNRDELNAETEGSVRILRLSINEPIVVN